MGKILYELDTTLSSDPALALHVDALYSLVRELIGTTDYYATAKHGKLFVYDGKECTADQFVGTVNFLDGTIEIFDDDDAALPTGEGGA